MARSEFALSKVMSSPPPDTLPFADVYIDESSQTNHRYLVLGGIILATDDLHEVVDALQAARLPELPYGVMKWGYVSRCKLPAYRRVVDAFFHLQAKTTLDFHSLVVDTTRLKHRIYNQGSREIGFNKEIYQLAFKVGRLYDCLLHVYPDRRSTNQRPEDLRLMLNRGIKKQGDTRDWPYRRLQFREPDDCQVLQLTDILIGALAYRLNGHHKAERASPPRVELSEYILTKAGIGDVMRDTSRGGKFTIWHRRLK
jgi:hypothetical protein